MSRRSEKDGAVTWLQDKIDRLSAALVAVVDNELKEELNGVQPEIVTGIRTAALGSVLKRTRCSGEPLPDTNEGGTSTGLVSRLDNHASSVKQRGKGTRRGRRKKSTDMSTSPPNTETDSHLPGDQEDSGLRIPGLTME